MFKPLKKAPKGCLAKPDREYYHKTNALLPFPQSKRSTLNMLPIVDVPDVQPQEQNRYRKLQRIKSPLHRTSWEYYQLNNNFPKCFGTFLSHFILMSTLNVQCLVVKTMDFFAAPVCQWCRYHLGQRCWRPLASDSELTTRLHPSHCHVSPREIEGLTVDGLTSSHHQLRLVVYPII